MIKDNNKLLTELNKIKFLSGITEDKPIKNTVLKESEDYDGKNKRKSAASEESEDENQIKKSTKELSNSIDSVGEELLDFKKGKEEDYIGISQKISMLVGSGDGYVKMLKKLIEIPFFLKAEKYNLVRYIGTENETPIKKKIFNEIVRDLNLTNFSKVSSIERFLSTSFEDVKRKKNELENDAINKFNVSGEEDEKARKLMFAKNQTVDKKTLDYIKARLDELKRDGYPKASGDEKAIISYNFSAKKFEGDKRYKINKDEKKEKTNYYNVPKLTPLGFFQIQFLSRVFTNQPKDEFEYIIFGDGKYVGHAEKILKSFYLNALHKPIAILTGRKFNVNPNDHEFEIIKDQAWDRIKDQALNGKYDSQRNNFGAWAFTVARNATINNIKLITDLVFKDNSNTYDGIMTINMRILEFKKPMDKEIPNTFLEDSYYDESSDSYVYVFKNTDSLIDFFSTIISEKGFFPQWWIRNMATTTKNKLKNIGAIKSVKKFASFYSEEQPEEEYDLYGEKAKGEEREKLFSKLADFYKSTTKMSINYDKLSETEEFRSITDENGNRKYTDEQIKKAFERDLGKALFFYQTRYTKNYPIWETRPPKNIIDDLKRFLSSKGVAEKELNILDNINPNVPIANPIFYQDMDFNKGLLTFSNQNGETINLDDYVGGFKERSAISKGFNVPSLVKEEFFNQQLRNKEKNELTYVFNSAKDLQTGVWKQIEIAIPKVSEVQKKIDKRRNIEYKDMEIKKLGHAYMDRLYNNPPVSDPEIRNYLIERLSQIGKNITITDNREKIYTKPKNYNIKKQFGILKPTDANYIDNPNKGETVFKGNFPKTKEELASSPYFKRFARFAGVKEGSENNNIDYIYDFLISEAYKTKVNWFRGNKKHKVDNIYKNIILSKFNPYGEAKKYFFKQETRFSDLKLLSYLLSKLSGVNVQLEENVNPNNIKNFINELKTNIFKTIK